ncbi:angiopoietin-1 receptor-like [Dendronephthya gigantea]|uniref:angiopoietin-1 receptor-like n=1 Tax=Dendronephthya gigantea TaxID=151771 RepID=UPI00106912FE|nr:angiopoietin-1 receptor-like [Dendronephthya gigantea]
MTRVEFRKNDNDLHKCEVEEVLRYKTLSCSVTVTGVTKDDKFMCLLTASKAPCNAAQVNLTVTDALAPKILRMSVQINPRKLEVSCIGSGIPKPDVKWLLNGSRINSTSTWKERMSVNVDTKPIDNVNGENAFFVNSTVAIVGRKFSLCIQCVAISTLDRVYSKKVFVLYVEVVSLKLTVASVRWVGHPDLNTTSTSYNVSLKSEKQRHEIIRRYHESSVTFGNLTMRETYTVSIESVTEKGDSVIGTVQFYSPGKLAKPNQIFPAKISSVAAEIRWEKIQADAKFYGVLLGYKVFLYGKNREFNVTLSNDSIDYTLPALVKKSKYAVWVRGFTRYGDGNTLKYNFTTLDTIPSPTNVDVTILSVDSAVVQWKIIEQHEEFDVITGYTVTLRNGNLSYDTKTSSESSFVALNDLSLNTNYTVSVAGLSGETKGRSSNWISFTHVDPKSGKRIGETITEQNTSLIIIIIAVAITCMTVICILVIFVVRSRRRNRMMKKNNEMVLNTVKTSCNNNLRILYPEYYEEDASSVSDALPPWELNRDRLDVLDNTLGGGYFGLVKEGILRKSFSNYDQHQATQVAVKTLKVNRGQNNWNELLREFDILKYVSEDGHENIIKLIGGCTKTVPVLLIMEFCPRGNLKDLLQGSRTNEEPHQQYINIYSSLTERQLINFAVDIARGMKFLFEKKVVHRDIASRNILLNEQLVPKIADFGLARRIDVTAQYVINKNKMLPVKWMSIEALEESRFTAASDIWSYGILLWEICTLAEEPYPDVSPYDILEYLHDGERMAKPEHCSNEIFSLMARCWKEVPEERPSFSEIYNSLLNMLNLNKVVYINVKPYMEVMEAILPKHENIAGDPTLGVTQFDENSSRDSGVYDTAF